MSTSAIPSNYRECPICHGWSAGFACPKCGQGAVARLEAKQKTAVAVFDGAVERSTEKQLQQACSKWLILNGAVGLVLHATNKATTCAVGVSDLIFGWPRNGALVFCAIEMKVGRNKATPAQQSYVDAVKAAGGISAVCRSLDELKSILST